MQKSKTERLRQEIYITIYGTKTYWGKVFDISLLLVIFFSIGLVMMESVDRLNEKYRNFIYFSEWCVTIFFTIEYILRILSNKKPWRYIFSFYGIVDLVSSLPMYVAFLIPNSSFLVAFRAFRLLRLFSILNIVPVLGQQLHLKRALKASRNKILVFIYFVLVLSFVLGTLMFLIEGKENGFTDIPTSIYWCIVTMTTVGYGDISPGTSLGQFIASLLMVLGYGIIAVPTGIVTSEYTNTRRKKEPHVEEEICSKCKTPFHTDTDNYCAKCGTPKLND